ncbi:MAG: LysR family transcriptional regulator substrate-binding protein, partial [Chloroflexi bacterium]|nr:LysR family transcriptional regulator substrate-binding protein [Chloroflexota bacterium]
SGRAGHLILGAASSVSSYVLPAVLKRFRAMNPTVELTVRTGHSERVLELVLDGDVELAITRELHHPEMETIPLYRELVALATHPDHPFARRGEATLNEVGAAGLVLFDRGSSYYDLVHEMFTCAGVTPRTVMELDNFEAAKKMVEEGLGVAILPRSAFAREVEQGQLAEVPMTDASPAFRTIAAIRRADVGPPGGIAAAFLSLIREHTSEPLFGIAPASTLRSA